MADFLERLRRWVWSDNLTRHLGEHNAEIRPYGRRSSDYTEARLNALSDQAQAHFARVEKFLPYGLTGAYRAHYTRLSLVVPDDLPHGVTLVPIKRGGMVINERSDIFVLMEAWLDSKGVPK